MERSTQGNSEQVGVSQGHVGPGARLEQCNMLITVGTNVWTTKRKIQYASRPLRPALPHHACPSCRQTPGSGRVNGNYPANLQVDPNSCRQQLHQPAVPRRARPEVSHHLRPRPLPLVVRNILLRRSLAGILYPLHTHHISFLHSFLQYCKVPQACQDLS